MSTEELRGFLFKQGAKGLVKGWKKRWFSLKGNRLYYYKTPEETNVLGFIDVTIITGARETPNAAGRKEKGEFLFEVYTPGRVYNLMATTEKLMKYWLEGLTKIIDQGKGTTSTASAPAAQPAQVPVSTPQAATGAAASSALATSKANDAEARRKKTVAIEQSTPDNNKANATVAITVMDVSAQTKKFGRKLYVVVSVDNSQHMSKISEDGVWNEEFKLDVPDMNQQLVVAVWAADGDVAKFVGNVTFSVSSISSKYSAPNPAAEGFPLSATVDRGELRLRILYTGGLRRVGLDDFELLKVLGKGNFGKVMQVRKSDTGAIYAMKVLKKEAIIAADAVQHTLAETSVLRRIKHPFIVSLKYAFQTDDKLYIILDYLNGGELFFHLSNVDRFSEERSRFYASEIILALGYLHENHIVYRDLKPENLLLTMDGHICVTDFGLVKENLKHGEVTYTFCGSPEYLAPEILQAKGYRKEVDWWALGTLIYEMLEGLPPFYDEDVNEMNRRILRQPLYFDSSHFNPDAISLLEGLLQRNPDKRLGSGPTDAEEIKSHPWFRDVNWSDLISKKVEPSFVPHLQNATDARYFDPEFTSQVARHSITDTKLSKGAQRAFDGFSYVSPHLENAHNQLQAKRKSMRASKRWDS